MEALDSATWRKSTYSGSNGGQCVEVGTVKGGGALLIRDTKNWTGDTLAFSPAQFEEFITRVRGGRTA